MFPILYEILDLLEEAFLLTLGALAGLAFLIFVLFVVLFRFLRGRFRNLYRLFDFN